MPYQFATLDPRPLPASNEANDKVFASSPVYGIEVTVPALAKRCIENLDPQHSGGDATRTAIENALTAEIPAEGSTLATIRADLDAIGAMAIFNLRAKGESLESAMERINMVATADKFARGKWRAKPLPTRDKPWAGDPMARQLAAISAAIMDFKIPMADRVSMMERWMLRNEEPEQYRTQAENERLDMITALETGQINIQVLERCTECGAHEVNRPSLWGTVNLHECGYGPMMETLVSIVEGTHRAATSVGYSFAPVVVAMNPAFKQGSGEPYRKFTVCTFEAKYADIKSALAELATLEVGWGGSPTIGGSPQGVSSTLTIDQVVKVVGKHLR